MTEIREEKLLPLQWWQFKVFVTFRGDMEFTWYKISKVPMAFSMKNLGRCRPLEWVGMGWIFSTETWIWFSNSHGTQLQAASWPYWSSSTQHHMSWKPHFCNFYTTPVLSQAILNYGEKVLESMIPTVTCSFSLPNSNFLSRLSISVQVFPTRSVLLLVQCSCHFWGHYGRICFISTPGLLCIIPRSLFSSPTPAISMAQWLPGTCYIYFFIWQNSTFHNLGSWF